LEHPVDSDPWQQQSVIDAERMFGRALWLKDNLPITPDEWGLLCLLIFGCVPEKRPTPEEFAQARAHYMSRGELIAFPVGDRAGVMSRGEAY
jgi:hypothetical protein